MRLLALSALVSLCSVGAMDWPAAHIAIGGVRREQGQVVSSYRTPVGSGQRPAPGIGLLRASVDVSGIRQCSGHPLQAVTTSPAGLRRRASTLHADGSAVPSPVCADGRGGKPSNYSN
ncbi:hypothetical protein [Streptomyces celluloflavus]|uniref:hypothetical protein n=1 Tax=Streptomyces celluloflavus TaxID=58344 RepID=UPI00345FC6EF|nr:hypothetical protein OG717_05070 [Streptomyces celluloflavus]